MTVDGREELAEMNLRAGQRARESNAYDAALGFFGFGLDLIIPASDPRSRHELGVGRIEAMYLCGRFEEAELLAERLLEHTETSLDKVAVLEQLLLAHTTRLRYRKAIDTSARVRLRIAIREQFA
jgi:predicted ATPase